MNTIGGILYFLGWSEYAMYTTFPDKQTVHGGIVRKGGLLSFCLNFSHASKIFTEDSLLYVRYFASFGQTSSS